MVEHRRTISRRAYVLPGWFLVLTAVVCLGGTVALGALVVSGGDDGSAAAAPATPSPSATASSATPTPSPTATTPSPEPTEEPEPEPEPEPEVSRTDVAVSVLNATRTPGLARTMGARVTQAGWTVSAVGNWRGAPAATTVHYPPGREAEARLLADDLGIAQTAPSLQGMSTDRLTVLLLSLP